MKIKIGVCAMDKKTRSKPMVEILERLVAGCTTRALPGGGRALPAPSCLEARREERDAA